MNKLQLPIWQTYHRPTVPAKYCPTCSGRGLAFRVYFPSFDEYVKVCFSDDPVDCKVPVRIEEDLCPDCGGYGWVPE